MKEKERYEFRQRTLFYSGQELATFGGCNLDDVLRFFCKLLNQQNARIKKLEEALKKANTNNYLTDYYLVEKENQQLKQSQKQLAMEELKKLSKHFVYSGDEIVSDYDLDCDPSELKEEIERMVKELKGEDNANQTKIK